MTGVRGPRGPQRNPRQKTPLATRFWARVEQAGPDECWLWTGGRDRHGYGRIGRGAASEGTMLAARLSLQLAGVDITGRIVRHHCDNPPCVNPRHLAIGTQSDNMRDAWERGRIAWEPRLTDEDVRRIRASTLTQPTLGAIFGVSQSLISRIQSGQRRTTPSLS